MNLSSLNKQATAFAISLITLVASLFFAADSAHAEILLLVQPVDATASSQYGDRGPERAINDSGLSSPITSGVTLPATYPTHDTEYTTVWLSQQFDETTKPTITFDLGAEYLVAGLHLWNENNIDDRGIADVDVYYSTTSATGGFSLLQSFSGANEFLPSTQSVSYTGDDYFFDTSTTARWIRFNVNSIHSTAAGSYAGISEIVFFQSVPEPASALLLGLAGLLMLRRRRASAVALQPKPERAGTLDRIEPSNG